MKPQWSNSLLTWFLCALATVSTVRADQPDSAEGIAYFETHIRPLLVERCYSCHSTTKDQQEGGLLLDSRAGWRDGGDNGPAVVPKDVDASLLIRAVRYADPDLQMPPDRKLSQDVIARLERWVRMGAPDPRTGDPAAEPPREDPSDPDAGRLHWAFRPLVEQPLPAVRNSDWTRSAIDSFILARLEAAELRPAPDADRRVLVRRVYFQLVGIPPTPSQVAAFLEDKRNDALPRLVDRLLHSPQFGERWGRHWLDLARYADSNGLDENFLFREAWRYRNWVFDAVNADTPFDRFVLEQIAGDLLPYDTVQQRDQQRIGAGFLVVGPKVLLGNDPKKQRMEVADEQINTVGRAILGQTLGCARCHDHKFDPVPTADYYALAGIFTSTQVMERRYMLGQQRVMERLVGLGDDGDRSDAAYEKFWREQPGKKQRRDRAQSALQLLEKDDAKALGDFIKKHPGDVAKEAADAGQPKDKRIAAQKTLVAKLTAELASPPPIPPRAMIPSDGAEPVDEHVRLAGQFDRSGKQVPRGFLHVLSDGSIRIPSDRSGRLELGRWLTDTDGGAGQLAARVLANRVWHHLFGRGVVRTVDNFGRTGEPPSHPQLLDYLATELIASGWSIKALVRRIVLSRTFAMSSRHDEAGHAADPENRLLWRSHRRRLDPESLRDAMLSVAGRLDLAPMRSSVWYLGDQATAVGDNKVRRRTDFPCRSVYLPVIRNDLPELFEVFDFADPHTTTGMRTQTTAATQGLYMLNDQSVMDVAESVARGLPKSESADSMVQRVDTLFQRVLGARATKEDHRDILTFVREIQSRLVEQGVPDAELRAWSMACHALIASSRFQVLE